MHKIQLYKGREYYNFVVDTVINDIKERLKCSSESAEMYFYHAISRNYINSQIVDMAEGVCALPRQVNNV